MFSERARNVLFYPERPSKHSVIHKIMNYLDYGITRNIKKKYRLIISWEDTTYRRTMPFLENQTHPILNSKCKDISKVKVDEVFNGTFGYCLNVDPTKFIGDCLKKSNLNAVKDGVIVKSPVEKIAETSVYQKLINNVTSDKKYEDIRVPIFRQTIPLIFLKYRSAKKRFSDYFEYSVIKSPLEVFSTEEVEKIITFCEQIGMDYGELDVLRDRETNEIYILDANNTPWGPPEDLAKTDTEKVIKIFSETFDKEFFHT